MGARGAGGLRWHTFFISGFFPDLGVFLGALRVMSFFCAGAVKDDGLVRQIARNETHAISSMYPGLGGFRVQGPAVPLCPFFWGVWVP